MPFIVVDYRAGDYKSRRIKQALLRGKDSLYKHKYLEDSKGKQGLTKFIFTQYSLQTHCGVEIPLQCLCMKVSPALCTQHSSTFWDTCRELTTGINSAGILQHGEEFNPHLMTLHPLPSAAAWGVTAMQIITFPLGRSCWEGIISDRVFAAPSGTAWINGSHQSLSAKELVDVFLAILAPNGAPRP